MAKPSAVVLQKTERGPNETPVDSPGKNGKLSSFEGVFAGRFQMPEQCLNSAVQNALSKKRGN